MLETLISVARADFEGETDSEEQTIFPLPLLDRDARRV